MTLEDPRLLVPPEEEDIYPYRRVWRSIVIEAGVIYGIAILFFVLFGIVGVPVGRNLFLPINLLLALLPLGLWYLFSWLPEQRVPQPRRRLLGVMIVSALAANAVGVPLINTVLEPERWLPLASAVFRIAGYTFTVGIVHTMVKYLIVRYGTYPDHFRTRLDGVAYCAASAIGYATVLNLRYVLTNPTPPAVTATFIGNTVGLQLATGIIIGYGLAETYFGRPSPLLMTLTLALSAIVTGIVIPFRAGLVNANLTLTVSAASPIQGLVFSIVVVVGIAVVTGFLTQRAEREAQEIAAGQEE